MRMRAEKKDETSKKEEKIIGKKKKEEYRERIEAYMEYVKNFKMENNKNPNFSFKVQLGFDKDNLPLLWLAYAFLPPEKEGENPRDTQISLLTYQEKKVETLFATPIIMMPIITERYIGGLSYDNYTFYQYDEERKELVNCGKLLNEYDSDELEQMTGERIVEEYEKIFPSLRDLGYDMPLKNEDENKVMVLKRQPDMKSNYYDLIKKFNDVDIRKLEKYKAEADEKGYSPSSIETYVDLKGNVITADKIEMLEHQGWKRDWSAYEEIYWIPKEYWEGVIGNLKNKPIFSPLEYKNYLYSYRRKMDVDEIDMNDFTLSKMDDYLKGNKILTYFSNNPSAEFFSSELKASHQENMKKEAFMAIRQAQISGWRYEEEVFTCTIKKEEKLKNYQFKIDFSQDGNQITGISYIDPYEGLAEWKKVYLEAIEDWERQEEENPVKNEEYGNNSIYNDSYYLEDINKDGIPELLAYYEGADAEELFMIKNSKLESVISDRFVGGSNNVIGTTDYHWGSSYYSFNKKGELKHLFSILDIRFGDDAGKYEVIEGDEYTVCSEEEVKKKKKEILEKHNLKVDEKETYDEMYKLDKLKKKIKDY